MMGVCGDIQRGVKEKGYAKLVCQRRCDKNEVSTKTKGVRGRRVKLL